VVYRNTGTFVEVYTMLRLQMAVVVIQVNTSRRPSTLRHFSVYGKKAVHKVEFWC